MQLIFPFFFCYFIHFSWFSCLVCSWNHDFYFCFIVSTIRKVILHFNKNNANIWLVVTVKLSIHYFQLDIINQQHTSSELLKIQLKSYMYNVSFYFIIIFFLHIFHLVCMFIIASLQLHFIHSLFKCSFHFPLNMESKRKNDNIRKKKRKIEFLNGLLIIIVEQMQYSMDFLFLHENSLSIFTTQWSLSKF